MDLTPWLRFAASVAVLLVVLVSPPAVNAQSGVCGDVDGDGSVNIVDALQAAQHQVGLRGCTDMARFEMCDISPVGSDGLCTISDALRMAQCSVGLISCGFACVPITACCGNGSVEAGEDCDDGNQACFDRCPPGCKFANACPQETTTTSTMFGSVTTSTVF